MTPHPSFQPGPARTSCGGEFPWFSAAGRGAADGSGACTIQARGQAFARDGTHYHDAALANFAASKLAACATADLAAAIAALAAELNGCWALVVDAGGSLLLAVDRSRSIPLFYSVGAGARGAGAPRAAGHPDAWPASSAGEWSDVAAAEFLAAGYVTGSETLDPAIRQVQAGEVVALHRSGASDPPHVEKRRYYRLLPAAPRAESAVRLQTELIETLDAVFERCVRALRGRAAIIPLSGGLDSRVVAAMLVRHGCRDALCMNYGDPRYHEVAVSRDVAAALGLRWVQAPFDAAAWQRWMALPEMFEYWDYAGARCSLPLVQDWPALHALRDALPRHGVFIPGHTLDMLSGGHLRFPPGSPPSAGRDAAGAAELVMSSASLHYRLFDLSLFTEETRGAMRERIMREVDVFADHPAADNAEAAQMWNHGHRQARFIINAVRAYEFFGHDWLLPGWDHGLMDFFAGVPQALRYRKALYIDACRERLFTGPLAALGRIDASGSLPDARPPAWLTRLKRRVYALPGVGDRRAIRRMRDAIQNDPYRMATWFTEGDYGRRVGDTRLGGAEAARLPPSVREVLARSARRLCIRGHYNGLLAGHVLLRWAGQN